LDSLRKGSPRFAPQKITRALDNGSVEIEEGGHILNVCFASAEYCYQLETAAIARLDPSAARIEIISANMKDRAKAKALEEYLTEKEKNRLRQTDSQTTATAPEPVESIGAQINRLREQCRWTLERLAEAVEIDPTNVSRHLSDKSVPHLKNLGAYERVFSKALGKNIVIHKTPRKRR
jgi:ribosome-binding protein aMBF1 (putative translation factor)